MRRPRKDTEHIFFEGATQEGICAFAKALSLTPVGQKKKWKIPELSKCEGMLLKLNRRIQPQLASELVAVNVLKERYYAIEKAFRELDLAYYDKVLSPAPILLQGEFKDIARVEALAELLVRLRRGRLSRDAIFSFLTSYQNKSPLTVQELAYFGDYLQVAVLRLLADAAQELNQILDARDDAMHACESLGQSADLTEKFLKEAFQNPAYLEYLLFFLDKREDAENLRLQIREFEMPQGQSLEQLHQEEHKRWAFLEQLVAGCLNSLKELERFKPRELVVSFSSVYGVLKEDAVFQKMDEASQDYYLGQVVRLAKKLAIEETKLADRCRTLAEENDRDLSYYLLGEGKMELAASFFKTYRERDTYTLLTLATTLLPALAAGIAGWLSNRMVGIGIAMALLSFIPLRAIASAYFTRLFSRYTPARMLPRIGVEEIPNDARTLVIIPALLENEEDGIQLIKKLEQLSLLERDDNLFFGLLGDFPESKRDEEAAWVKGVRQRIEELNQKYGKEKFFYWQRRRTQTKEGTYAGWERKRGALLELSALLLNKPAASFYGLPHVPKDIRYIVTLDADTSLTPGSVKKLVGVMLHPANQPVLNEEETVVRAGHGLVLPAMDVDVDSAQYSYFSRIFAGRAGIDSYTAPTSELYQDAFAQATYMGKGIFDVALYHQLLAWLPEGQLLSHDLLEGSLLRAGLASDIRFTEEIPGNILVSQKRDHRWTRGDWQLIPFLGQRVRDNRGRQVKNPLSRVAKYKIWENLLRTALPWMSLLLILFGYLAGGFVCLTALLLALLPWFFAPFLDFNDAMGNLLKNVGKGSAWVDIWREGRGTLFRGVVHLCLLPCYGANRLDAVSRALYRLLHSKKKLLEWETSKQCEKRSKDTLGAFYRELWFAPVFGALQLIVCILAGGHFFYFSLALFLLFSGAPLAAHFISLPVTAPKAMPTEEQARLLGRTTYQTWRFFEDFADEKTGLAPDNVQFTPKKPPVWRTSPTNTGYSLISNLLAYDAGYLDAKTALERMEQVTGALENMEKWNGHPFNWESIPDLHALEPRFVSTVDSGNLACYLLAARAGVLRMGEEPRDCGVLLSAFREVLDALSQAAEDRRQVEKCLKIIEYYEIHGLDEKSFPAFLEQMEEKGLESLKDEAYRPFFTLLKRHRRQQRGNKEQAKALAARLTALFDAMNFSVLYDKQAKLFHIGVNLNAGAKKEGHYDLLASEVRQASLIAISKGDVPYTHWFQLSRPLVGVGVRRALLSWNGAMFEYFMPTLLFQESSGSLLGETAEAVLGAQKSYVNRIPFGISESQYACVDEEDYYQYRAFGIPRLGLSDSKGEIVISPYSTFLAMHVDGGACLKNLTRLVEEGAYGPYGFWEALDYQTPGEKKIVQTYMAHHQGMILAALINYRFTDRLKRDFYSNDIIQSYDILLKEKVPPRNVMIRKYAQGGTLEQDAYRPYHCNCLEDPYRLRLLSNGRLQLAAGTQGGWQGWWDQLQLTRDGFHVQVLEEGVVKMCGNLNGQGDCYADLGPGQVGFLKVGAELDLETKVSLLPEEDVVLYRVCVRNKTREKKKISLLGWCTPVLYTPREYTSHPTFFALFLETKLVSGRLVVKRRKRTREEKEVFAAFGMLGSQGNLEYETDRAAVLTRPATCAGGAGGLPPALAAREEREIEPGGQEEWTFALAIGQEQEALLHTLDRLEDPVWQAVCFGLSETYQRSRLLFSGLDFKTVLTYDLLYARLLKNAGQKKKWQQAIRQAQPRETLFALGISAEQPLAVLYLRNPEEWPTLLEFSRAAKYFEDHGFLGDYIALLDFVPESEWETENVRLLTRQQLEKGVADTLLAAAGVVLEGNLPLEKQLCYTSRVFSWRRQRPSCYENKAPHLGQLAFWNGWGGFYRDGSYRMLLTPQKPLPGPMGQVLGDAGFGSFVTAQGWSYTWAGNSRLFRVTPYDPDPAALRANERVYVMDLTTGECFCPLPNENSQDGYLVEFSPGQASWATEGEISSRALQFVPEGTTAKVTQITLENSGAERRIALSYVVRLQLSENNESERLAIVTSQKDGVLTAWSPLSGKRGKAFCAMPGYRTSFTTDAEEAFGVWGGVPSGVLQEELSGYTGAGTEACFLLRTEAYMPAGGQVTIPLVLGFSEDPFQELAKVEGAVPPARYDKLAEGLQIETPDTAMNLLVNHWLPYQTLASRVEAKTGFYQSGGAIGFRDQLQDMLLFLYTQPSRVREHILLAASKQFLEGDVLHWWHPGPGGKGVRTHMTDDRLFLPYVALEYIRVTQDTGLLKEPVRYLASKDIPAGQKDLYDTFRDSGVEEPLLDHLIRAVDKTAVLGRHGLPLMGGGDWNDALDGIGEKGKGESVWLGFFLYDILEKLIPILKKQGRTPKAQEYETWADGLRAALNHEAWDGAWYLRAFWDSGEPLGSSTSAACKIDLISQAWAVLSGAGDRHKAKMAMESALSRLKKEKENVLALLTPPFDNPASYPGYIQGYQPGIRENGGQYNHAVVWAMMAACRLGWRDVARELWEMVCPIFRTETKAQALAYRGEPYVLAADIYTSPQQAGRAGWTWYTGSGAWLYHVLIQEYLGIKKEGKLLKVVPLLPEDWEGFSFTYRFGTSEYHVRVHKGGRPTPPIRLEDTGEHHQIDYYLGPEESGV